MRRHFVGLDVHKDSITVAYALGAGEVELLGRSVVGFAPVSGHSIERLPRCWHNRRFVDGDARVARTHGLRCCVLLASMTLIWIGGMVSSRQRTPTRIRRFQVRSG